MALALLAGMANANPPARGTRFERSSMHMGTEFRLVFYAQDEAHASKAAARAFARVAELDRAFSDYRDDSELTRLCQQAGGPAVPVGADLYAILRESQELARSTGGAFDVTVGPFVRLWRRARRTRQLPTPAQIELARERVGYSLLELGMSSQTARLARPNMQLDLGGIAKGFACDEALRVLEQETIVAALVDGGGGISVSAPPPGQADWSIAIAGAERKNPASPPGDPLAQPEPISKTSPFAARLRLAASGKPECRVKGLRKQPLKKNGAADRSKNAANPPRRIHLAHAAVATSGDAEQYVELGGQRYSHIVDPRTGLGLTNRLQVTVVAREGWRADGLATALCVMGVDRGRAFIDQHPEAAALFVLPTPTGLREVQSKNWVEWTEKKRK